MPSVPKDPVNTSGQWVSSSNFSGRKSFGYFECGKCGGRGWVSAHAYKQFKQACTQCHRYSLPVYMWVNLEVRAKSVGRGDDEKPHLKHLCEACKLGVCSRGGRE